MAVRVDAISPGRSGAGRGGIILKGYLTIQGKAVICFIYCSSGAMVPAVASCAGTSRREASPHLDVLMVVAIAGADAG